MILIMILMISAVKAIHCEKIVYIKYSKKVQLWN